MTVLRNDRLQDIAQAENGGDWPTAVALRLARQRELPEDVDNLKRLASCAEQSGQLEFVIPLLKTVHSSEYHDLRFSLVLIRYAVRHNEFDWAEEILSVIRERHASNEWPVIAEAELLHQRGRTEEALFLLSGALPRLTDTYAFLNVSDVYYKLLNEAFAELIDTDVIGQLEGPAVNDALYVTLVKDEADIIFSNLDHHYRLGFRNFIIIDNESQDGTIDEVQRFRASRPLAIVFTIQDPIVGYVQDSKTTAAMHFAATILAGMEQPIRWVFPVDADEFICLSTKSPSFKDILNEADGLGKQVLTLVQVNAATPHRLVQLDKGSDPVRLFTRRMAYPTLPVFKVGVLYGGALSFDMGNHRPSRGYSDLSSTAAGTRFGMFMLHFPLRSIDQVRRKVLNGIRALDAAPHRVGIGGHWRRWHQQYLAKGELFFEELLADFIRDIGEHDDRRRDEKRKRESLHSSGPL